MKMKYNKYKYAQHNIIEALRIGHKRAALKKYKSGHFLL